jgi:hypothetical protein
MCASQLIRTVRRTADAMSRLPHSLILPLAGSGFRLTVGDDGEVHDWVDLVVPSGEYLVSVASFDDQVSEVQLRGPSTSGDLAESSTIVDMGEGSVFCLADFRYRQPELGAFLAHEGIAAELGDALAKVMTPEWLGTPVLLAGPTGAAFHDLWLVAWGKGGGASSTVSLTPMED